MYSGDQLTLNKKVLSYKETKQHYLSKRALFGLKQEYSINQIFQTRFPQYMLNVVPSEEYFEKIIKTLSRMCQKSTKEKQNAEKEKEEKELLLRKCCQLLFSKKQKQALKDMLGKQFPFLLEQEAGSKMLNIFLQSVLNMQADEQ